MAKPTFSTKTTRAASEPTPLSDNLVRKVVKAVEQSHSLRLTECLAQELISSAKQDESLRVQNQVSSSNVEAVMHALSIKLVGTPLRSHGSRDQIRDFYEKFGTAAKANGIELLSPATA